MIASCKSGVHCACCCDPERGAAFRAAMARRGVVACPRGYAVGTKIERPPIKPADPLPGDGVAMDVAALAGYVAQVDELLKRDDLTPCRRKHLLEKRINYDNMMKEAMK